MNKRLARLGTTTSKPLRLTVGKRRITAVATFAAGKRRVGTLTLEVVR